MINIRSSKSKGMPRVHRGAGAGCDMQHVERGRDAGRALSTHQAERERERESREGAEDERTPRVFECE